MPKKKARFVPTNTNKLQQYIEQGKDVKGLTGYVKTTIKGDDTEEPVCIAVRVTGQQVLENGCGIVVTAVPIRGLGEIKVTPCSWIDDKKHLEGLREYTLRVKKADDILMNMFQSGYVSENKSAVLDYIAGMGKDEIQLLRREMQERHDVGENTDWKNILRKCPIEKVKQLALSSICKDLEVDPNDVGFHPRYY